MTSQHVCREFPVDRASVDFHATEGYGQAALAAVGGPYLDEVTAGPMPVVHLGGYMPQLRMRRRREILPERLAYGIRLDQILRRKVHTAAAVRAFCGVPAEARLVLLCFASDVVLEELWDDELKFAAVAGGNWDVIVAPSYSLWFERPRPLHFHSIKRSYLCFEAFQTLGALVVPRAEFIDLADVEIQADWFEGHPDVEMVALDWMTCRADRDWLAGAELLAEFDRRTEMRLHYLINGTTVFARIMYLFELLSSERLTLTDATAATPPDAALNASFPDGPLMTSAWERRVRRREAVIEAAQMAARSSAIDVTDRPRTREATRAGAPTTG